MSEYNTNTSSYQSNTNQSYSTNSRGLPDGCCGRGCCSFGRAKLAQLNLF